MKLIKWFFRLVLAGLVLCMAALAALGIYALSAESGAVSGERSSEVTMWIQEQVQEHIESSPQGQRLAEKAKEIVVRYSPYGDNWNTNIRKLAHFSLYFVLGAILYMVLSILKVPFGIKWFLCIAVCAGFAYFDELHQGSVDGRAMSRLDMLIDTAGAFTSVSLLTLSGKFLKWLGN